MPVRAQAAGCRVQEPVVYGIESWGGGFGGGVIGFHFRNGAMLYH